MAADVPKIVLVPHERSHHFNRRECIVNEELKVGRSVDKKRILPNNLIFDCRVLSRNHAVIWFENGKFFIKDTKSSNGTFVNENRLSPSGEESGPVELRSRDIVQFGVNVNVEKKVTHGCIIATILVYLNEVEVPGVEPPVRQVMQLVQSALIREQELENKLASMQGVISVARELATNSMIAIVKEDELMSRLEMLENQLQVYSKNSSDDELKKQLSKVFEDKHQSEQQSKDSLRNLLQEKLECTSKLNQLQRDYDKAEQECQRYRTLYDVARQEHSQEVGKLSEQIKSAEKEKKELESKLTEEKQTLKASMESLQAEADFSNQQLTKIKARLEETEDELVQLKISTETEKQRKAKEARPLSKVEEEGEFDDLQPLENGDGEVVEVTKVEGLEQQPPWSPSSLPSLVKQDTLLGSMTSSRAVHVVKNQEEQLKFRINDLEKKLQLSETRVKDLERQLGFGGGESSKDSIRAIARRITTTAIARGQVEILQCSLTEAEERIRSLESSLQSRLTEVGLFKETVTRLEGDLKLSCDTAGTKVAELSRVKGDLGSKDEKLASLQATLESFESECEELKSSNSSQKEQLNSLNEKYTGQLKDGVRIKTENTVLVKEVENLNKQLDSLQKQQKGGPAGQEQVGTSVSQQFPLPSPPSPHFQHRLRMLEDDEQRVKLLTFIALVSIGVALASWLT